MGIIEKAKDLVTPGKTTHTGEERTGTVGTTGTATMTVRPSKAPVGRKRLGFGCQ